MRLIHLALLTAALLPAAAGAQTFTDPDAIAARESAARAWLDARCAGGSGASAGLRAEPGTTAAVLIGPAEIGQGDARITLAPGAVLRAGGGIFAGDDGLPEAPAALLDELARQLLPGHACGASTP